MFNNNVQNWTTVTSGLNWTSNVNQAANDSSVQFDAMMTTQELWKNPGATGDTSFTYKVNAKMTPYKTTNDGDYFVMTQGTVKNKVVGHTTLKAVRSTTRASSRP